MGGVKLGGGDLDPFLQGLREHGCSDSLGAGLSQLLVHLCKNKERIPCQTFYILQNMFPSPRLYSQPFFTIKYLQLFTFISICYNTCPYIELLSLL